MNYKHGLTKHPLYSTWVNMNRRCYSKKSQFYSHYGERGITVCDRWRKSFPNFLKDMGEKPSPKLSLDRIDNNKGYSPENCKWSTQTEQNNNRRMLKNNISGTEGVSWSSVSNLWLVHARIGGKRKYLGSFKNIDVAVSVRHSAKEV